MEETQKDKSKTVKKQAEYSRLTPEQLKESLDLEAERRQVIKDFVRTQLEQDKDYGKIAIRGRDGYVSQSKPVLFKSGMEKIFSFFNVVSTLERDAETIEMVGKPGLIAYKCILTREGKFVSEGRGACEVKEKIRVNDAIKIAEKRARMDACLNLGFSEYFTQDLEDMAMESDEPLEVDAPEKQDGESEKKNSWKNGEIRNIEFSVSDIETKQTQSGNNYVLLHTDRGLIKAWKNTMADFEVGKSYKAAVEAVFYGGVISLAVARLISKV